MSDQPPARRGFYRQAMRAGAATLAFALLFPTLGATVHAAELIIDEGVVVKFGNDASLVVRDKLTAGSGVSLTSANDDTTAGQTNQLPGTPAAGSWKGLSIEKSASAAGQPGLNGLSVRYGSAGLTLRGVSPNLQLMQLNDNLVGLRTRDGANPAITGSSFLRNGVGIEALGGSVPNVTTTQFSQNTGFAITNATPASVIQATGNWWGHASGPKDATGNPAGQGDAVSAGVNYSSYVTQAPLLSPSIRLASPAAFYATNVLALELACVNATEYRIAENDAFTDATFVAMPNGKATVNYTASSGDGRKSIGVQFRNAAGTVVTARLTNPAAGNATTILIDSAAPTVAINNPAPGSVLAQPVTVEASATDAGGLAKVEFFLDGQVVSSQTTVSPSGTYTYAWNTNDSANGDHTLRVLATDEAGRTAEQSRVVTVSRTPPAADTTGPAIANARMDGVALANGATVTRDVPVSAEVTDRSGVARVDLLLDGQTVATPTTSGNGVYTATFSIDGVGNGSHSLAWRAVDSLNNVSTTSFQINVAHAAPAAPVITNPQNGLTTRTATVAVSGTSAAGTSVQLLVNGQGAGPLLTTTNGAFSGSVPLASGSNQIQARASNSYGQSAASNAVTVTLDTAVPSSPSNLAALALADGKVRLTWTKSTDPNAIGHDLYRSRSAFSDIGLATKVNSSPLTVTSYEDLPSPDGVWYYRLVAINSAQTPSVPTDLVQVTADGTPPKAVSVVYQPLGKVDSATGRIGQGKVNVQLNVSEELQAAPYLAVVPGGGTPIVLELTKSGTTSYTSAFLIDANTPSGTANVLFSARDAVGNRGTEIAAGATLKIDTEGPALSSITLSPGAPIKVSGNTTVQGTFVFSKAPKAGVAPQVKYLLSGSGRQPVVLPALTAVDATTWKGSFTVTGRDDCAPDGLQNYQMLNGKAVSRDPNYIGLSGKPVNLVNLDNVDLVATTNNAKLHLCGLSVVSEKKINATTWEYTVRGELTNTGLPVGGVVAKLNRLPFNVLKLIDDTLVFGAVGTGETAKTNDTITLRANFQVPDALFKLGIGFTWSVTVQP